MKLIYAAYALAGGLGVVLVVAVVLTVSGDPKPTPPYMPYQLEYSSQIIDPFNGYAADCELRGNEATARSGGDGIPLPGDVIVTECRVRTVSEPVWEGDGASYEGEIEGRPLTPIGPGPEA